jgi:DNA-binding CsgD family transcriptional regulator
LRVEYRAARNNSLAPVSDFIDVITLVARGGTVLDSGVVRRLLTASRRGDALAALTPREREVLSVTAQGRSDAAIAGTLFVSPRVVDMLVADIFDMPGLAPTTTTTAGSSSPSGIWRPSVPRRKFYGLFLLACRHVAFGSFCCRDRAV